jgi:membrane protease YdiL (CAAX protease family)
MAGILMTLLVAEKGALRDLNRRLLRWRVSRRWYAVALLVSPFLEITVLLVLARISPVFLPSIITADDKLSLLTTGVVVGLVGGFVEELGWTGFVIPRLRVRYSVFTTGLIVGVLWGAWHLLQMWWVGSTSSATLPPVFFLPIYFLSAIVTLTAYRVLMVWVYDHTGSLLIAILMHASHIFSTLFVIAPPTQGVPFLLYSGTFAAALWIVVAAVAISNHGHILSQPRQKPA